MGNVELDLKGVCGEILFHFPIPGVKQNRWANLHWPSKSNLTHLGSLVPHLGLRSFTNTEELFKAEPAQSSAREAVNSWLGLAFTLEFGVLDGFRLEAEGSRTSKFPHETHTI